MALESFTTAALEICCVWCVSHARARRSHIPAQPQRAANGGTLAVQASGRGGAFLELGVVEAEGWERRRVGYS